MPENIKIIGVLDEDEKLGDNKKARMITRFAQRSMKYSHINYSPRNDTTIEKQLFLGAEFQFKGIGFSISKFQNS